MSISYDKIQATLTKINTKQKEVFAETVMKRISIDGEDNMVDQVKRIMAMKETFVLLDKKTKKNNVRIYESIADSLSHAISEHAQILIDHANEVTQQYVKAAEAGYEEITDFSILKKGDKVCIENNSIYEMMGFDKVHGEILVINPSKKGCSIKCVETGAMEGGDFDDGTWYIKK